MTHVEPPHQSEHPLHEAPRPATPAAHYFGALLITGIVTGISFVITPPAAKWITFSAAAAMDIGVLLAFAVDMLRSRSSRGSG